LSNEEVLGDAAQEKGRPPGKVVLAPEHQCSLRLNKLKSIFSRFSKNLKLILGIVNVVSHKHAKS
jgi:hypothetical protein